MPPSAGACQTIAAFVKPDWGRAGERSSTITAIGWRAAALGGTRRPVRGAGTRTGVGAGVGVGEGDALGLSDGAGDSVGGAEGSADGGVLLRFATSPDEPGVAVGPWDPADAANEPRAKPNATATTASP